MSGRSVVQTLPAWLQRRLFEWRRDWQRRHLKDPRWAFLFEPSPPDEWVALDCETTGLNVRQDEIIAIGSRPLVGYYLEFDVAMIDRALKRCFGLTLPQQKIEVSAMYYDWRFRQLPPYQQHDNADIDLRFATILQTLDLPMRDAHDALNDAVMAALAFIRLRGLRGEAEAAS